MKHYQKGHTAKKPALNAAISEPSSPVPSSVALPAQNALAEQLKATVFSALRAQGIPVGLPVALSVLAAAQDSIMTESGEIADPYWKGMSRLIRNVVRPLLNDVGPAIAGEVVTAVSAALRQAGLFGAFGRGSSQGFNNSSGFARGNGQGGNGRGMNQPQMQGGNGGYGRGNAQGGFGGYGRGNGQSNLGTAGRGLAPNPANPNAGRGAANPAAPALSAVVAASPAARSKFAALLAQMMEQVAAEETSGPAFCNNCGFLPDACTCEPQAPGVEGQDFS